MIRRLENLKQSKRIFIKDYMEQWEVSHATFFRDLQEVKLFYGIEFKYNRRTKSYDRV